MAIIGSGPAGITISVLLARRGYDMTIFESREKIGAGNSAMDVARTALRKGVRHVSVF